MLRYSELSITMKIWFNDYIFSYICTCNVWISMQRENPLTITELTSTFRNSFRWSRLHLLLAPEKMNEEGAGLSWIVDFYWWLIVTRLLDQIDIVHDSPKVIHSVKSKKGHLRVGRHEVRYHYCQIHMTFSNFFSERLWSACWPRAMLCQCASLGVQPKSWALQTIQLRRLLWKRKQFRLQRKVQSKMPSNR